MKVNQLIEIITQERNSRIDKSNPTSRFIFQAYTNVISKVQEEFNNSEIITPKKIDKLPVTKYMNEKLKKMLKTKPKKKSNKKDKSLHDELVKFMGLGPSKAQELIDQGLKSIDQMHKRPWFDKLPIQTQTFLKNKPLRKIPHEKIKKIEKQLTKTTGYKAILVGSYRRKTSYSRDIDVMLVSDNKKTIEKYLMFLKKKFKVAVYSLGLDKMSLVICPSGDKDCYKLDAFLTPKKHENAMLLYSTGSKSFNIRMRAKAKRKGYLLNQNGLYHRNSNKKIKITSEKGFFDKLDMDYVEPEKRF